MSFKKRVVIIMCCFLILLISLISTFIYFRTSKMLNDDAKTLMYAKLDQISDNVKSTIEINKEKVKVISRDNYIKKFLKKEISGETLEGYLLEVRNDENKCGEFYKDILVIDLNGIILASASKEAKTLDISDRVYFKIAKLTNDIVLSDGLLAKTDNDFATVLLSPIYNQDNDYKIGYVAMAMFSERFTEQIQKIELGNTGYYIIVDSKNKTLTHKYKSQTFKEFNYDLSNPTFSVDTVDGRMFVAHRNIDLEGHNWKAVALLSEKEIYYNSNQLLIYILAIGSVFVIMCGFIGIYLSNLLILPIVKLTGIIKKLSTGDRKYNEDLIDELDSVAGSILGMRNKNIIEVNDLKEAIYSMKKYIQDGILVTIDGKVNNFDRCTLVLSNQIYIPLTIIKSEIQKLELLKSVKSNDNSLKKLNENYRIIEKQLILSEEKVNLMDFNNLLIKNEITVDFLMESILEVSKKFVNENNRVFSFTNETKTKQLGVIKVDLFMIKRAWMNFLYNSISFTDTNEEIKIKFSVMSNSLKVELIYFNIKSESEEINEYFLGLLISERIFDAHDFTVGNSTSSENQTKMWFDVDVE